MWIMNNEKLTSGKLRIHKLRTYKEELYNMWSLSFGAKGEHFLFMHVKNIITYIYNSCCVHTHLLTFH